MSEYQVKFESVAIGALTIQIRSLKDRQQFSDPEGVADEIGISSANWSLFGVIWPSALILADLMNTYALESIKILEVGCGLALASLVASSRGANITASDYHPLSDDFLQKNTTLNHFPPITFSVGDWSIANPQLGKFDLIIGSDILYERNHPALLSEFIHLHSNEHAKAIIVDPGRGHQAKFTNRMTEHGFSCVSEQVKTPLAESMLFKGKMLTYSRSSSACPQL